MQWINFQQTIKQRLHREQLDQEQIKAKNFDLYGHALVRGVAGSGKSLVLRNRVEKILEAKLSPVLVLSYNRFMAGWLTAALAQKGLRAECQTFHRWSYQQLGYEYRYDRKDELRQKIVELAQQSQVKYQAILVDEAQDFYDEWFQALLAVLDRQTDSLFFVYDNTQSVYGQSHRRKNGWSWSKLGIEVVGRSQIFDLNYRNSPEILELSWKFIQPALGEAGMGVDRRENSPAIDKIIEPKKNLSRSSGVKPLLVQIRYDNLSVEIAKQVQMALATGRNSSIGILTHPSHPDGKTLRAAISKSLYQHGIHYHAPTRSEERIGNIVERPCVIVDSWNALKGVEFDAVILVGLDWVGVNLEQANKESSNERISNGDLNFEGKAGAYTAMTRARDHLVLLYEQKTPVVEQVENALNTPDQLSSQP